MHHVGAGEVIEQKQRQMRDRADPGTAHGGLALVCFGIGDGLIEAMQGKRFAGHQHHGRAGDQNDRLKIGPRIVS
jgi:hypothetical protein